MALEVRTFLFFYLARNGVFFLGPSGLFRGFGSDATILLGPSYADSKLYFSFDTIYGLFCFFGPLGLFWDSVLAQNFLLGPANVDYQSISFVFGSTALSFRFYPVLFGAFFALFGFFGAFFRVGVRFINHFGTYLHKLTTFILEV